jgi:pyruvate dehydrogenase E2 component (dihydrolipoyllysine-residue acetyltransferase)
VVEFVMPILAADMTAGTLVAWRKQRGDAVKRGDIIAEVETDKGLIDVEVFVTGVVEQILIQPGATVPTGTVLALIRDDGPAPAVAPEPAAPAAAPARLKISPAARRLAEELGMDVARLSGTGPDGAITREDVERAAAARPAAAAAAAPRTAAARLTRMRQTIGAAMARSKREIPHYYLATTIDMYRTMTWLAEENLRRPVTDRLLYGVLLLKAVALALREVPELNAVWRGGQVVQSEAVHVGVAVSLRGGGLVAPALHDADHQSLGDLMRNFRDLVQRARTGGLRSSELSDPTVTITSLGEQGVESVFGIIYPPQVAIVGFGRIVERPWSVDGSLVSRQVITATLSADHRVTDGHRGSRFLTAVDRLLQEPARL